MIEAILLVVLCLACVTLPINLWIYWRLHAAMQLMIDIQRNIRGYLSDQYTNGGHKHDPGLPREIRQKIEEKGL